VMRRQQVTHVLAMHGHDIARRAVVECAVWMYAFRRSRGGPVRPCRVV
jgi:hypothetical protein